jgi:tetratricopeptide (TPR) repeat protein
MQETKFQHQLRSAVKIMMCFVWLIAGTDAPTMTPDTGFRWMPFGGYLVCAARFRTSSLMDGHCLRWSLFNPDNRLLCTLRRSFLPATYDAVSNYLMADILIREGAEPGQPQFVEAKADLTRSLTAKPDSAEAQILMGTLCQQENNLPEALQHFQQALKNEPDDPSALNHELLVLRAMHKMSDATEVAKHLRLLLNNRIQEERPANDVRVAPRPTN